MADLMPGQWEVNGLLMGRHCMIKVSTFEPGGKPDATLHDQDLDGGDGKAFGIDTLTGRTIAMTMFIDSDNIIAAARAYSDLAGVWFDPSIRRVDGAVVALRYRPFAALPTRVVYGRPRRFDPVHEELLDVGRVDVVADFDCLDPLFYADPEQIEPFTIPINPPTTGGWTAPFTAPIIVGTTSEGFGEFTVEGSEPTPLIARIHGPITNPVIDYLGHWRMQLGTTLLYDQWVDIDARPPSRTVLRSDGVNLSGAFDAETPPLSDLVLEPGPAEIVLRGYDQTGTAHLTITPQAASAVPYWP